MVQLKDRIKYFGLTSIFTGDPGSAGPLLVPVLFRKWIFGD